MEEDDILDYISKSTNGTDIPCSSHKTEIKQSNFGLGLFAIDDIDIGEIITYYPAHIAVHKKTKEALTLFGSKLNEEYGLIFNNYTIYGDPNIKNKNWIGHLLNDGGDIIFNKKCSYGKWFSRYILTTTINSNCNFINDKKYIKIVCKKKINKGDELFVSYGFKYWMNRVFNIIDEEPFLFKVGKELGLNKINYLMNLK